MNMLYIINGVDFIEVVVARQGSIGVRVLLYSLLMLTFKYRKKLQSCYIIFAMP
jgi:hypothetical protein